MNKLYVIKVSAQAADKRINSDSISLNRSVIYRVDYIFLIYLLEEGEG